MEGDGTGREGGGGGFVFISPLPTSTPFFMGGDGTGREGGVGGYRFYIPSPYQHPIFYEYILHLLTIAAPLSRNALTRYLFPLNNVMSTWKIAMIAIEGVMGWGELVTKRFYPFFTLD